MSSGNKKCLGRLLFLLDFSCHIRDWSRVAAAQGSQSISPARMNAV